MYRGDYRELTATITDSYNAGSRLLFAVKAEADAGPVNANDSNAVFTVDLTGDKAIDNGNGTITFTIPITTDKTDKSLPGDYEAQLRYINANNKATSYEPFSFTIEADYNQRA